MGEVDQGVPLGRGLGVEFDFVVETVEFEGRVVEVDYFVDEAFAGEAGGIDAVHGPV